MINQKIIISNKEFNLIKKEKKKEKKIVLCHVLLILFILDT